MIAHSPWQSDHSPLASVSQCTAKEEDGMLIQEVERLILGNRSRQKVVLCLDSTQEERLW